MNGRKQVDDVKASTLFIFYSFDGCCEKGNELSSSLKGPELIDQLSDCQFLKKIFDPRSQLLFIYLFVSLFFLFFQIFLFVSFQPLVHTYGKNGG